MFNFFRRVNGLQKTVVPVDDPVYSDDKDEEELTRGLLRPASTDRFSPVRPSITTNLKPLLWLSFALLQIANLLFLIQWRTSLFAGNRRPSVSSFEHLSTRPPSSDLDVGEDSSGITPKCESYLLRSLGL